MSFRISYFYILLICFFCSFQACNKKDSLPWEYVIHDGYAWDYTSIYKIKNTGDGLLAVGGERFNKGVILKYNALIGWELESISTQRNKSFHGITENTTNQEVIVVGMDGNIVKKSPIESQWLHMNQPYWEAMNDIAYTPNNYWIVSGLAFHNGKLFNYDFEGNISIEDSFDHELNKINFDDYPKGIILGYGIVLETKNAGVEWEENYSIKGDHFIDYFKRENKEFIIGSEGSIWERDANMDNWLKIRNGTKVLQKKLRMNAIFMLNDKEGFIACDEGILLYTKDGWKNKTAFRFPDLKGENILSLGTDDAYKLWCATSSGTFIEIFL